MHKHKSHLHKEEIPTQECPKCGMTMIAIAGAKSAICKNCGYKEPCC